jgi:uncharacterized protein (DUF885 family)
MLAYRTSSPSRRINQKRLQTSPAARSPVAVVILPLAIMLVVATSNRHLSWGDVQAPSQPSENSFQRLSETYLDEFATFSPVYATGVGDHRYDSELDQVSTAARVRHLKWLRDISRQLSTLDPAGLSRPEQVDWALLHHEVEAQIWRITELQEWAWNPLVYTGLAGDGIYDLMARDFAPISERLSAVRARLEQFPRFLAQVRETLEPARVPRIHAETAVSQNRGILAVLKAMVEPNIQQLGQAERAKMVSAIRTAREAIQVHQEWLEQELLPNAKGDFRLGQELYDQKLAFSLHSPLDRHQILQLAEKHLADLHDRMYKIAQPIYAQTYPLTKFPDEPSPAYRRAIIRFALEKANEDLHQRDGVVAAARRSLESATEFVKGQDLVTVPPDPLEVIVMPEFQRGVSVAYCDSPGPLDEKQTTFYAVSPIPDDWSAQQVRSFLQEYNSRSLHVLTIHEAMPGHYLQLAHSSRYPGKLRRLLESGVFIEGWAIYTEWMMCEEGFLDHDPLMKLVTLKWYLRDVTNAILDQAIHVDGMSRDDAMRLMVEDAFQEEREASGKWVRAQLTSAQLSTYFVGKLQVTALRDEAQRRWGDDFSIKSFHDSLLSFGSPPPQFVRALLFHDAIPLPKMGSDESP